MASEAYMIWATRREARLDELYRAHSAVGGTRPGRRVATEQLNWSITLRLAAEFQGFVRDLHDESAEHLGSHVDASTPALRAIVLGHLTIGRRLDTGNATLSNMQQDFLRLGLDLRGELHKRYAKAGKWLTALSELNDARNGAAHSDHARITRAAGRATLRLAQVQNWHRSMRALSRSLDRTAASGLARLTGGSAPW